MTSQFQFLKKSFELKKISHAYIFSGNDQEKKQQVLNNFLEHLAIQAADIVTVRPEQEITIAQIRELSARAALGAWASPFKIFIIEQAELMNVEAQSALLKLLEEPKGDTIFFLLTQYPFLLLATIRSRTQELKFWNFLHVNILEPAQKKEFLDLETLSLEKRFEKSKELSEDEKGAKEFLQKFLQYLRAKLHQELQGSVSKPSHSVNLLKLTQETLFLVNTTNASPRLILDRLFLSL